MKAKNNFIRYIHDRMVKEDIAYIAFDSSAYEKYAYHNCYPYQLPIFTDYNTNKLYYISKLYLPTLSETLGLYSIRIELRDQDSEIYEVELMGDDFDYLVISNLAWVVFKETEEENREDYFVSLLLGAVFDY